MPHHQDMSASRPKNHKRKRTESYGLGDFMHASDLKPMPGDLVEIDRTLYSHWAVFVGNGQVVHVQGLHKNGIDIPLSGSTATVKIGLLVDVCGSSSARVNNKEVPAKERGLEAVSPDKVVSNARKLVGKTDHYNLVSRNCEHYVTEWKYGKGWSDQANIALTSNGQLAGQTDRLKGHVLWLNGLTALLGGPQRSPNICGTKSVKMRTNRPNHLRHSARK